MGASGYTPTVFSPPNPHGLEPYDGPWGFEQAAHLLRRTTFGPSIEQIRTAASQNRNTAVQRLFQYAPMPAPPVNTHFANDPSVPIGSTWIDAPYQQGMNLHQYRFVSLMAWTSQLMVEEQVSIREKMTLFWHNYFAISNVNEPRYLYKHITVLRQYATGNFRNIIRKVTIDPAMLRFLNGNQNVRQAPNENYARELLELFTLGKGASAGPGDYTTYTEEDISAIAKVMTGWKERGYYSNDANETVEAYFDSDAHDTSTKQLSHRFNNKTISNMGQSEYLYLLEILLERRDTALHVCRRLYRWFVYYHIDETIEQTIIEPMADLLINNNYELAPVMRTLLASAHFYEMAQRGSMIKNPMDFMMGLVKPLFATLPDDPAQKEAVMYRIHNIQATLQMKYFTPPQVAGWKAYYLQPHYYRYWINASTLQHRTLMVNLLSGHGLNIDGFLLKMDLLAFLEHLDNPADARGLVGQLAQFLFSMPPAEEQLDQMLYTLLNGLPEYEWALEYEAYLANPSDMQLSQAVLGKFTQLVRSMLVNAKFNLG